MFSFGSNSHNQRPPDLTFTSDSSLDTYEYTPYAGFTHTIVVKKPRIASTRLPPLTKVPSACALAPSTSRCTLQRSNTSAILSTAKSTQQCTIIYGALKPSSSPGVDWKLCRAKNDSSEHNAPYLELPLENVNSIHCGSSFSIAVTDKRRKLWVLGDTSFLQSGLKTSTTSRLGWKPLNLTGSTLSGKEIIKSVACGGGHALVVLGRRYAVHRSSSGGSTGLTSTKEHDHLIVFGSNEYSQLGYKSERLVAKLSGVGRSAKCKSTDSASVPNCNEKPKKITSFQHILMVAAGKNFSLVVSMSGNIYCCGINTHAECGLGFVNDVSYPFKKVHIPQRETTEVRVRERSVGRLLSFTGSKKNVYTVKHVSCGNNHTVVCLSYTDTGKDVLLAWGKNDLGQCGVKLPVSDLLQCILTPTVMEHPVLLRSDTRIEQVCCAGDSTIILTGRQEILICGSNAHNRLSESPMYHFRTLQLEEKPFQPLCDILSVAAGEEHVVFSLREKSNVEEVVVAQGAYGASSHDIWCSIEENLLNDTCILSSNAHVKLGLLYLYSGRIPKFTAENAQLLIGMLHVLRLSPNEKNTSTLAYTPQTEDDIQHAARLKAAIPVKKELISALQKALFKFVSCKTVSLVLRCIDAVAGVSSVPPSLQEEYSFCMQYLKTHKLNKVVDADRIPAHMRVSLNSMTNPLNENALADEEDLCASDEGAMSPPPPNRASSQTYDEAISFNVAVSGTFLNESILAVLWRQVPRNEDCHILTHSKKVVPCHAWILALFCPAINKYLSEELKSERSLHLQGDDAFIKALECIKSTRDNRWESGFIVDLSELVPHAAIPTRVVKDLVQYIYTKRIVVNKKNAPHLKMLWDAFMSHRGSMYQLDFVLDRFVRCSFTVENVLEHFSSGNSREQAENWMVKNWQKVNDAFGEKIMEHLGFDEYVRLSQRALKEK